MMSFEERKKITPLRFEQPRAGDRFEEMMSYWFHVMHVDNEVVVGIDSVKDHLYCYCLDCFRNRAFRTTYPDKTFWSLHFFDNVFERYTKDPTERGKDFVDWYKSYKHKKEELNPCEVCGKRLNGKTYTHKDFRGQLGQ